LAVEGLRAGELVVTGDAAHYVRNVLRAREGQALVLFDGCGLEAQGRLRAVEPGAVTIDLDEPQLQPPPPCDLTVGAALPRGERADWMVEKLTEVGVSGIVWLASEHGVSTGRNVPGRTDRWIRVARAAAAQAGRAHLPRLEGPVSVDEFVSRTCDQRFIGCTDGDALPALLRDATPISALLAIGPEGGFTAAELAGADEAGWTRASLGPYTMRIETAAVAGAAMILARATGGEAE
jgi:16S rRNA (uracil1498-N3)-methyltransferase